MSERVARLWFPEEDEALRLAVGSGKTRAVTWNEIAKAVPGRTGLQCQHRWIRALRPDLKKGPWTEEEDTLLKKGVGLYGTSRWTLVSKMIAGRYGNQCRERWINHLAPGLHLAPAPWTAAEDVGPLPILKAFENFPLAPAPRNA